MWSGGGAQRYRAWPGFASGAGRRVRSDSRGAASRPGRCAGSVGQWRIAKGAAGEPEARSLAGSCRQEARPLAAAGRRPGLWRLQAGGPASGGPVAAGRASGGSQRAGVVPLGDSAASPCRLSVSASPCRCVPVSPCRCVTVSPCPRVPVSLCRCVTVLLCPRVAVSLCHCVTVSLCRLASGETRVRVDSHGSRILSSDGVGSSLFISMVLTRISRISICASTQGHVPASCEAGGLVGPHSWGLTRLVRPGASLDAL